MQSEEVAEHRLGLFAGNLATGDPQMSEPAKAIKLPGPALRRRRDLEGRLRAKRDEAAGKTEMPVVDLCGEARVGGAQILGGKQKLLGLGAGVAEARHTQEHEAAKRARPPRYLGA